MTADLVTLKPVSPALRRAGLNRVPALIANEGEAATKHFLEFFTAMIRNRNTRAAYARAIGQFMTWCEDHGLALCDLEPIHVAT